MTNWKLNAIIAILATMIVLEGLLLLHLISNPFPPEHIYYQICAPGQKVIALFSVKYQSVISWLPSDVEPCYYLTIVDSEYGRVRIRKNQWHGDLKASFLELARKHAPWAVQELEK